jgi:hypothetical protein
MGQVIWLRLLTGQQFHKLRKWLQWLQWGVTFSQPGCLADWLLTGLGQPQINP